MSDDRRRLEFLGMIERAVRIGSLLPDEIDLDHADLPEIRMLLDEFCEAVEVIKTFRP
jgi:hypothetical protein